MLLSVERPFVGAFAFHIPRATLLHSIGLVQAVLPASVRTCANGQLRFPRNLGDPVVSSANSRLEIPGDQLQASAVHSAAEERTYRVQPRYRQAKATKRGGMGGGKSQHPRSTDEAGELAPRDPVKGRKNRIGGAWCWDLGRELRPRLRTWNYVSP
jgi:hypothetical protein